MLPETRTIETERLLLNEITPELYTYILTHFNDEEIKQYFDFGDKGLAQAKERFKIGVINYYMTYKYFLLKDKQTGTTIGSCGYYRWYEDHNRAEIGYVMTNESYRGQGLMKEAATRILKFGFEEMNLHRVEAFAGPENTASIKIIEALGLKYEGVLRDHYLSNGVYSDSACYALIKSEYQP